jgi:hypothetical protein
MGSFSNEGRRDRNGQRRRRHQVRERLRPLMESLEARTLLSNSPPNWKPTNNNLADYQNGPMALAGQYLVTLYEQYQSYVQTSNGQQPFQSNLSSLIEIKGDQVGVDVTGWGNFSTFETQLQNLGMQIGASDSNYEIAEGWLPISDLPTVAELPQIVSIHPLYHSVARQQGSTPNQSDSSLQADVARSTYNVNGAGSKIGVLSDSVNQYQGGLAASVKSGDLPNNVQVLTDGVPGSTDEGRAMLEQIYDIAPGASLAFSTADDPNAPGDIGFANGIRALAQVGSNIEVDDIGYPDEPFFQPGIISQAVADVVQNSGVTYFSAAGNASNSGYLSAFRGVNATVTGIGTGRFMNFDPNASGQVVTNLPITVTSAQPIYFQWDNPWYVSNGVTSNVFIFILDANNNVVASGNANAIAADQPEQFTAPIAPGNYTVAIQVEGGSPDPNLVQFIMPNVGMTVSTAANVSGPGITYGTSWGHPSDPPAIGVGAVPWWITTPWSAPGTFSPLTNEGYSSFGPWEQVFTANGTRLASPVIKQTPEISAPDANDTSFFIPGLFLSTVNPPPGSGPATKTELDGDTHPNFFGTSSAAPNLAAVAALMKQLNPAVTSSEILNAFETTATPLNGSSQGQYDVQGGFGLANAVKAMNAIDLLRVTTVNPPNGATLSTAPTILDVNFSRPLDFSTVNASDLVFKTMPNGVTVTVGTPIEISPTRVFFPITLNSAAGVVANGNYAFQLPAGAITSADKRSLAQYSESFTLGDTIPPQITNTTFSARTVTIQFSEPMRASTINPATVILARTGSSGVWNNPTNVLLNTIPGFAINYDPTSNRATIDLTKIPQSQLPSDNYALIVEPTVTDVVGNQIAGAFNGPPPQGDNGIFPSGTYDSKGKLIPGTTFIQYLPNQVLQAPIIQSVGLDQTLGPPSSPNTSDTGIPNDQNTKVTNPFIAGHIASPFLTALSGVTVVAEFNGLHSGAFGLSQGAGGRGYSGMIDVSTTTDAGGNFVLQAPGNLPDGLNQVRLIVIGQSEASPLPGLSSLRDASFRVDTSDPLIQGAGDLVTDAKSPSGQDFVPVAGGANLSVLSNLSIAVIDPVNPTDLGDPFAVPTQLQFPALDPNTANNLSNYTLLLVGPQGTSSPNLSTATDESSFITGATFVPTDASFAAAPNRQQTNTPYFGRVDLTFAPGLPSGQYVLVMRYPQSGFTGVADAAGNPIIGNAGVGGPSDFNFYFNLQPTAAYVTNLQAISPNPSNPTSPFSSPPRSFFEIPSASAVLPNGVYAPPTEWFIDFSNELNANSISNNSVELIAAGPSGDFGLDPTFTNGVGYSIVPGTTVTLVNSDPTALPGQPGYQNRLVVRLAAGTTLAANHYRLFIPNRVNSAGQDTRIYDVYGSWVDGEFLGNPTAAGGWEDLLHDGSERPGMSGDGVPGGSFETSYIVVPFGNVIYARPDYQQSPFNASTAPDGSQQKPYPTLAAEAVPNALNGGNLNSVANFGTGFNPAYDRNGDGQFEESALYAAQVLSQNGTVPVVVVAMPAAQQVDPITGAVTQKSFVLQAPAGSDPAVNDGSASVPSDVDLVFAAGSTLKLLNASLFVQQQGSSMQVEGTANNPVTFTSYHDDAVGGAPNGTPSDKAPAPGDWGGLVLRNFDDTSNGGRQIPAAPGPTYLPLAGPGGINALGVSGADDALSFFNFANIKFAGGAVPASNGFRFDAITLFNSRPLIANTGITNTGGVSDLLGGGQNAQSAISADFDSFREDLLAHGPLIRRVSLINNSINGILVRAELTGVAQPTDSINYPENSSLGLPGGSQNYSFFAPVPYVLLSRLEIGTELHQDTGGQTTKITDRLYIDPGAMIKFQRGAAIDVNNIGASINIGDRNYLDQYDLHPTISPNDPVPVGTPNSIFNDGKFHPENPNDAKVVLTSLFDVTATTTFIDPVTGNVTPIVAPIDTANSKGTLQPTPGNVPPLARWGGISVLSGALSVINATQFYYGGGSVNSASGTIPQRDVLAFEGAGGFTVFGVTTGAFGTRAYITNNDFFDNAQAAISDLPDGLLAGDPQRPLVSGHPFFRGNVFQRNDINGLEVLAPNLYPFPNLTVSSVWDSTDLTYALRGTIYAGGAEPFQLPIPSTVFTAELKPFLTLTLQSALPDTLLADGSQIPKPGEPLVVKLLNSGAPIGDGVNGLPANIASSYQGGAGFMFGIDNGIDPTADPLWDLGAFTQLRITGIAGDETTGQSRVPVKITSLHDDSVGTSVRGVKMFQAMNGNTTAPAPGDGGLLVFGGTSLSDYNLMDPRDGNLIDNADIKYMTRIEQEGGGWVYTGAGGNTPLVKLGLTPDTQFNTAKAMTISNSNLSSFSQVGVLSDPGTASALDVTAALGLAGVARDGANQGQGTLLFMYNDSIANMPVGVRVESGTFNDAQSAVPAVAVFLNNTFYNDPFGVQGQGAVANGQNFRSHVYLTAMDNIFDQTGSGAISVINQAYGSQAQYDLYDNANAVTGIADNQPIIGNPLFIDAVNGNFNLQPNSPAINAARSELGPLPAGNLLAPIATQVLDASGGIRNTTGRNIANGGLAPNPPFGNVITLPGYPLRDYFDEWYAAVPGTTSAVPGPASNAATYVYVPAGGKGIEAERDQRGYLILDDPNRPQVGFGSRPYFNVGAFDYRLLQPPEVINDPVTGDGITALVTNQSAPNGVSTIDLYKVGSLAGTNKTPQELIISFNNQLDPNSVTDKTVLLESSGGTGVFSNSASNKFIDLSGKLNYNNQTKQIIINLSGLKLADDVYRVVLLGDGANVIHDPEGEALDGENLDANGNQRPLPSGDGVPGGNFQFTFIINSTPSMIVPGTLRLDPTVATTTPRGNFITKDNTPSFVGTIQNAPGSSPTISPLAGQTVILDFAGPDGVFGTADDLLNEGTAVVAANGTFTVQVGVDGAKTGLVTNVGPLPDTQYNVGPDGYLGINPNTGGFDDSNYGLVRVRVIDTSGNQSDPNDPNAQTHFVVDTKGPQITGSSPEPSTQAVVNSDGSITVSLITTQNLDPATVNASTIKVVRSGGTGVFTGTTVPVTIGSNITLTPLPGTITGAETLTFTITGATVNDFYQVTLVGTGRGPITDIAGNPLAGTGANGTDYNLQFVVFNPSNSHLLYVGQTVSNPNGAPGSRANPFPTIAAGLAAANPGDVVGVLPGVYNEQVVLKSLVRLLSASNSSTDNSFVPGNATQTIIRTPVKTPSPDAAVVATNLISLAEVQTEIAGFSISNPLQGDPNTGTIDVLSSGVLINNSEVLVDKNYILDSGNGITVNTAAGSIAGVPVIQDNAIIGNNYGMIVDDAGAQQFRSYLGVVGTDVANNDFAFNNLGLSIVAAGPQQTVAGVVNNIFDHNFNPTNSTGVAIFATTPNRITVSYNMFNADSSTPNNPATFTSGVGGGFNPAALSAVPDQFGNFTGLPFFVNPRDPRPFADGPANFYFDGDYDITSRSNAIDNALASRAPTLDFLYRSRTFIPSHVHHPGTGPADVGAFEFNGLFGIPYVTGSGQTVSGGGNSGGGGLGFGVGGGSGGSGGSGGGGAGGSGGGSAIGGGGSGGTTTTGPVTSGGGSTGSTTTTTNNGLGSLSGSGQTPITSVSTPVSSAPTTGTSSTPPSVPSGPVGRGRFRGRVQPVHRLPVRHAPVHHVNHPVVHGASHPRPTPVFRARPRLR